MDLIYRRVESDKSTLTRLKSAGDEEDLVRYIDHSFTSDDEETLSHLADCLSAMDFTNVSISKAEDERQFLLECVSVDCTELHSVIKTSVLMSLIAEKFGVSYDGWGCLVASES